jgi:hypothetical protein
MDERTYAQRDLWKESRDKSTTFRGSWLVWILSYLISLVFKPKPGIHTFGAAQRVMAVDLNKYRDKVNVEMLIDQGVRVIMLRVGGPTQWVYGDWKYEIDQTFTTYYARIRAYAKLKGIQVWIIGYWVHNAWSNEEGNYLGIDPQVTMFKEATRNHQCDLYAWDDEVGTCWKGGKEITITPVNLLKSISLCMEQTWNEFERWPSGLHKMVVHYSANWFIDKFAKTNYIVWLDASNKTVDTRHMMTWRAWVPTVFSTVFALIGDLFDALITPTGIQENAYLTRGSGLTADFWQATFTAMGLWCPYANGKPIFGIDASAGYGPSAVYDNFIYNANLPKESGDGGGDPNELESRVTALEATVSAINVRLDSHIAK